MTSVLNIIPSRYRPRVRDMVKGLRNELSGHYAIPLAAPVAYCYIRKNACSAFRRMIIEHSLHPKRDDERPVFYMDRCHRLGYGDLDACAHAIFVIRDPYERIVSGYLQQVVSRLDEPYPVLAQSVREIAGRDRAGLSFADFVELYLGAGDFSRIDVHFMPQVAHLAPIRYSDVLWDRHLAEDAAQVFGPALAEEYFRRPVNAMAHLARHADPDAWKTPAGELHRRFTASGALPARDDLLTPALRERLAAIYAADLALFERYLSARAADPSRAPALDMRDHDFSAHFSLNRPRRGVAAGIRR